EMIQKKCFTTKQVARKLNRTNKNIVILIKNECFPNAFKYKNRWYIPKEDVDAFKKLEKIKLEKTKNCMEINSTAKILNISITRVKFLIKNDPLSIAFKFNNTWWIHKTEVKAYKEHLKKANSYMNMHNTAKFLNISIYHVKFLIKDGTFSNAFKHNNRWHILKEEIDAFKEQEKIKLKKTKDCMDVNSTAKLLDIPIHRVKYLIKNGTFSDAFKHNERWYISRDHVDAFK